MQKSVIDWTHSRGMLAAIDSIDHLEEVRKKVIKFKESGELHQLILKRYMDWLDNDLDSSHSRMKSIILLALPRPAHTLTFSTAKGPFVTLLPPTYVNYDNTFKIYLSDFKNCFGTSLGEVRLLQAPLKTLAVHLGLASYGKNNITYVGKFGSYHQLMAFVIEKQLKPYDEFKAGKEAQLEECSKCSICETICPTKAITSERFLLKAEKCLTFHNEKEGELPENVQLRPKTYPCFIGCMTCQEFCPANKNALKIEPTGIAFDEMETEEILKDEKNPEVWAGIKSKFEKLGMMSCEKFIGRNLRYALQKSLS
jgi:epoxyqueuosine reductase